MNWEQSRLILRLFGPMLESAGLLDFAPDFVVYRTYGRLFFPVYLLFIPMLSALHQVQFGESGKSNKTYRIFRVSLVVGAVTDAIAYWGVTGPESNPIQGMAFMIELVALLVILVGLTLYGIATLERGLLPRWLAWLILLSGPAGIWLSISVIGYVPNGTLFPMAIAWITLGIRGVAKTNKEVKI